MSALVLTNLIAISESHPLLQLAALTKIAHRERRNVMPITIAPSVKSARLCSGQSSGHTSTSDVSLCYKNGWFLAISDDGTVNGTSNVQSPDSKSTCSTLLLMLKLLCLGKLAKKVSNIYIHCNIRH